MILAIDIGNSNIVFGIFEGSEVKHHIRLNTDSKITLDELKVKVSQLLSFYKIDQSKIVVAVIASVVPNLTNLYLNLIKEFFQIPCYLVRDFLGNLPLKFAFYNVTELGEDRIANAVAAMSKYEGNVIVVDLGTAITFDVITSKDGYVGGVIFPGTNLAIDYLSRATAKLPKVDFREVKEVVGKNTIHAIESGIFNGYLAMIEGIIRKIEISFPGLEFLSITTGGMGKIFADNSDLITNYDPFLTLNGLRILYEQIIGTN